MYDELFCSTVSESTTTSLVGLAVNIPRICRTCQRPYRRPYTTVVIGSSCGPHAAGLTCRRCGHHMGWLSGETFRFIEKTVATEWIVEALKPPPILTSSRPIHLPPARVRSKLHGIIRRVATAREGERNAVAFWGGCRMGEMVAAGLLGRDTAIALIVEATSRCGLTSKEAQRAAANALRNVLGGK
jgi:hypothetical protein